MGFLSPAIIKGQQSCLRNPRSKASKSSPKVSISELHTTAVFAFDTLVQVPLFLVILFVIKRQQKLSSPGWCCAVSTNVISCFLKGQGWMHFLAFAANFEWYCK